MLSAPRIVDIQPQGVHEFIEAIASTSYELSHQQGGSLPYTVIREITENFIHAGFLECTVSILDEGNTLRFADQGPGIKKKDVVLRPGISSATRKMKDYIRGVGSGFPIVREYLSSSHGYMSIEDNAEEGAVVTISLVPDTEPLIVSDTTIASAQSSLPYSGGKEPSVTPPEVSLDSDSPSTSDILSSEALNIKRDLSQREERSLQFLNEQGMLGPVDLADLLGVSAPTATRLLQKLEQQGMVESTHLKKRILSNMGMAYLQKYLGLGMSH